MSATLTFVPTGGLGNRIRALDAAIRLAAQVRVPLCVYWFVDWQMPCRFSDLFRPVASLPVNVTIHEVTEWQAWTCQRPSRRNLWIPKVLQRFAFQGALYENQIPQLMASDFDFKTWVLRHPHAYMASYDSFLGNQSPTFPWYGPSQMVQTFIDQTCSTFRKAPSIGIHIRRTDNVGSIQTSPTELFIQTMQRILKEQPGMTFFLATDSEAERRTLQQTFGADCVYVPAYAPHRQDTLDVQRALSEMYILASCQEVIGSYWSSFSKVAALMGGKNYRLISQTIP